MNQSENSRTFSSSSNLTIAVAIATYNGASYIAEQLESLEMQQRKPDQIVVVDDASSDETVAIVRRFATKSTVPTSVIVHSENRGVKSTFSEAMMLADADIIMFSDQDDVWSPSKLERVVGLFHSHPGLMVIINDQAITDKSLRPLGRTKLENVRAAGLGDERFITGCCTSFRRVWRDIMGPVPEAARNHDGWINQPAHELGLRLILEESHQLYRRHDATVTDTPISGGKKPGFAVRIRRFRIGKITRANLKQRAAYLSAMIDRLEYHMPKSVKTPEIDAVIERMRRQKNGVVWRLALLRRNRVERIPIVGYHWGRGDYNLYSGWFSAVKDLLS